MSLLKVKDLLIKDKTTLDSIELDVDSVVVQFAKLIDSVGVEVSSYSADSVLGTIRSVLTSPELTE